MGTDGNDTGSTVAALDFLQEGKLRLDPNAVRVESPLRQNELDIYWTPRHGNNDRYPVGYNVYRLTAPQFTPATPNAVKLNTAVVTVAMYRDTTVDTQRHSHPYYVVTEVFADGSELPLAPPATLYTHNNSLGRRFTMMSPPRIYREFRRRKHIILDNTAEIVDILIRRASGTRCPCFNCEYGQSSDTNCPQCFGTGWERGYELLRDVPARVMSLQEVLMLQPQGIKLKSNPRGWLVDFPILRNGDVFIRRNGLRMEVNSIEYMDHQGILTHQDFDLVDLPLGSIVYNYDVTASDDPGT